MHRAPIALGCLLLLLLGPACPSMDDDDTVEDEPVDDDDTIDDDDDGVDDDDISDDGCGYGAVSFTFEMNGPEPDDDDSGDDDDAGDDDDSAGPTPVPVTIEYVVHYWNDYVAEVLGCEQHLLATGTIEPGPTDGCQACAGLLTLDPAAVVDVSDPSTDLDHCDPELLDEQEWNFGARLVTPVEDGGWGDFLTMALVDDEAAAELDGWFDDPEDPPGRALTHYGFIQALPGSLAEASGIGAVSIEPEPGSDWLYYWVVTVEEGAPEDGFVGLRLGEAVWVITFAPE